MKYFREQAQYLPASWPLLEIECKSNDGVLTLVWI